MLQGIGFLILMFSMLARGPAGNADLLDLIPSETYWQTKHITPSLEQLEKDAGPDAAAAPNTQTPAAKTSERSVRRLMAIRTLGEVHQKTTLPFLKTLTTSKELFVADYANRAIAATEGKTIPRVLHQKDILADLQLLPKNTGIAGQATDITGLTLSLDKIADLVVEQSTGPNQMPFMQTKPLDKKTASDKIDAQFLAFVEEVGNMRPDSVTVGIADNVGDNTGWVVTIFRGKYDAHAFYNSLKAQPAQKGLPEKFAPKFTREGNVDIMTQYADTFLFPSNDQLIVVAGPPDEDKTPVVTNILAVLKGQKGEFDQNQDLAALLKTTDTSAPIWAAGKLTPDMQKEPLFAAFNTFTLSAKQPKENLTFTLSATGTDADKVKDGADQFSQMISSGAAALKTQAEQSKAYQPLADMLAGIKVTPNDKSATVTGEIKPSIVESLLAQTPMAWLLTRQEQNGAAPDVETLPPATAPN